MALQKADGFDIFSNVADVSKAGYSRASASNVGFSTSNGRFGGGCLSSTPGTTSQGWNVSCYAEPGQTLIISFAFFHNNATAVGPLVDAGLFVLNCSSTGVLTLFNQQSSIVATSEAVVTPNSWHWVEVKVTLGTDNTSGVAVVRVNDSTVISVTGQDFFNALTSRITSFLIVGPNGTGGVTDVRVDDMIIMDGSGAAMNDFIGDTRIETLRPDGDGAVVDWTASAGADYQCVDETTANDDTDYISSNVPGQESRFSFADLSSNPSSIDLIQVRIRARKDNAGTRSIRGVVNSDGNEEVGPTLGLSTEYSWLRAGAFLTNPDGDDAWDGPAVDDLEVGVEVVD
jgi:hypothetical protein